MGERVRLREAVEASGRSQDEIAQLVGMNERFFASTIAGRHWPEAEERARLCSLFGVEPDVLFMVYDDRPGRECARLHAELERIHRSPREAAQLLGIEPAEFFRILRHGEQPTQQTASRMVELFGVPLDELLEVK